MAGTASSFFIEVAGTVCHHFLLRLETADACAEAHVGECACPADPAMSHMDDAVPRVAKDMRQAVVDGRH